MPKQSLITEPIVFGQTSSWWNSWYQSNKSKGVRRSLVPKSKESFGKISVKGLLNRCNILYLLDITLVRVYQMLQQISKGGQLTSMINHPWSRLSINLDFRYFCLHLARVDPCIIASHMNDFCHCWSFQNIIDIEFNFITNQEAHAKTFLQCSQFFYKSHCKISSTWVQWSIGLSFSHHW